MAFASLRSCTLSGVQALPVSVEVHTAGGLPGMSLVGLPQSTVRESKDRVRAAIENIDYTWPQQKIIVNLAPADLPKHGGRFDLPIALGILMATRQLPQGCLDGLVVLGELGLDGELRSVSGVLPTSYAYARSNKALYIPLANVAEALRSSHTRVHGAGHLRDACDQLKRRKKHGLPSLTLDSESEPLLTQHVLSAPSNVDMRDVFGQHQARRALEIAAAGSHNLLMVGPPGTGKSMLASRLPDIQPTMSEQESMESASIASPEFTRSVLDVLREPMETGEITVSRAARQATFPSRFQLVAAMNPCPCGYHDDPKISCRCSAEQILRYQARVSGPFLDRIDLHLQLRRETLSDAAMKSTDGNEESSAIRLRVEQARHKQLSRQGVSNARLDSAALRKYVNIDVDARKLLSKASTAMMLSLRAQHRLLRVARTIADLENGDALTRAHLAECLCYRRAPALDGQ